MKKYQNNNNDDLLNRCYRRDMDRIAIREESPF